MMPMGEISHRASGLPSPTQSNSIERVLGVTGSILSQKRPKGTRLFRTAVHQRYIVVWSLDSDRVIFYL